LLPPTPPHKKCADGEGKRHPPHPNPSPNDGDVDKERRKSSHHIWRGARGIAIHFGGSGDTAGIGGHSPPDHPVIAVGRGLSGRTDQRLEGGFDTDAKEQRPTQPAIGGWFRYGCERAASYSTSDWRVVSIRMRKSSILLNQRLEGGFDTGGLCPPQPAIGGWFRYGRSLPASTSGWRVVSIRMRKSSILLNQRLWAPQAWDA
jgi:hypothetical protein